MWYVYILKSRKYHWFYIGLTNNLRDRYKLHNEGKVKSTRKFKPFKLIYYEAYLNRYDTAKREQFLKTGWGKNWIKRTLKNYLSELKSWEGEGLKFNGRTPVLSRFKILKCFIFIF